MTPTSLSRRCATASRDGSADVHVLADLPTDADGETVVPAERAVELRNRKQRPLVLMVPVGAGRPRARWTTASNAMDVTDYCGSGRRGADRRQWRTATWSRRATGGA